MSLSLALQSALTGLNATSRQASAISNNVANATTPGYGKRSLGLSALNLGGAGQGVRVTGTLRHADLYLINDRRKAQAQTAESGTYAGALSRIEKALGDSETAGSLASRVNALETALLEAASHPESETRLAVAVIAGQSLVAGVNQASAAIQEERMRADRSIGSMVEQLNTALSQVESLDTLIASYRGTGRETASLIDQRQQIIDRIAEFIPLRELPRDGDRIALISTSGAVLLDGKAAVIGFSETRNIVPEMAIGGALSGLTLNGKPLSLSAEANLIRGGKLAAEFAIRDDLAIKAQSKLDAFARDLIQRFSDPALDPSLSATDAGLFTDSGLAFDPLTEVGLAERLQFTSRLDPDQPHTLYRLRDGLGAPVSGPSGASGLITALAERLAKVQPLSGPGLSGSRSVSGFATDLLSQISSQRVVHQGNQAFASAKLAALVDIEAAGGVDIEAEMQSLLVIEKAFAANAKVIQAADEMLNLLLGL